MTARPLPKHKPRTESANSTRFRILSAVLGFASEPLTKSLLLIAGAASWLGFFGFMFLVGTFVMMGDIGGAGVGSLGAVLFGVSGFACFSGFLKR